MDRINVNGIEYVRADQVQAPPAEHTKPSRIPQPRMVDRKCNWCKKPFKARAADVKRGWAKFCSKSCKASRQEKNTGQYRTQQSREYEDDDSYGHIFASGYEGHGQD
ncbi:hypothetical protein [uncultured Massilia sp.]|uniref:hypothetical protein n=1 Tax=uncultured Massilia sp. TaxID=169973 RepID=UPI0025868E8F|nr:hypothetical protein [uncultured Massilia sp.]